MIFLLIISNYNLGEQILLQVINNVGVSIDENNRVEESIVILSLEDADNCIELINTNGNELSNTEDNYSLEVQSFGSSSNDMALVAPISPTAVTTNNLTTTVTTIPSTTNNLTTKIATASSTTVTSSFSEISTSTSAASTTSSVLTVTTPMETRNIFKDTSNSPKSRIPSGISELFKKKLFWPNPPTHTKKRKSKVKLPTVLTQEEWVVLHEKENEEKHQKKLAIENRKLKRLEVKEVKRLEQERKKQERELKKLIKQEKKDENTKKQKKKIVKKKIKNEKP